jgi:hypothetical protein
MMRMNMMTVALAAAGLLLAGWAGAQVSDVSENVALDTRSHSAVANVTDQDLDTRTYTEEWSAARKLNTKKIIGTLILMR